MSKRLKNFLRAYFFWIGLAAFFLLWQPIGWRVTEHFLDEANSRILAVVQAQADAIIWSVENAVRLIDGAKPEKISTLLKKMARQPGIAWLAIVSEKGKIIADSDPSLEGKFIYTASEIKRLAPKKFIKSRFSPDEPTVFESWKLFQSFPGQKGASKKPPVIFAGLDASGALEVLDHYSRQLSLYNLLGQAFFFSIILLIYFILQFSRSRIGLKDTRALAAQIVSNFPDGLLMADNSGKILLHNRRMAQLLEIPDDSFPSALARLPLLDWEKYRDNFGQSGKISFSDYELRFPQGLQKNFVLLVSPIVSGAGKPAGHLFLLHDRSEIAALQRKLEAEQRYSAIGKLASGVAHEIRNPLSSMCGYAAFLAEKLGHDPSSKKIALLLVEEGKRLNGVLSEMLAIARKPALNKQMVNLPQLLQKLILLASADARAKNVNIIPHYPQEKHFPQNCLCDADKLLQALLNILLNALAVSPSGATVDIYLNFIQNGPNVPYYRIDVKDHGSGIPESMLSQIFNPYFSGRPNGTGLGLTIARQIAESHDGQITVASKPGAGAVFSFILPASEVKENEKTDSAGR